MAYPLYHPTIMLLSPVFGPPGAMAGNCSFPGTAEGGYHQNSSCTNDLSFAAHAAQEWLDTAHQSMYSQGQVYLDRIFTPEDAELFNGLQSPINMESNPSPQSQQTVIDAGGNQYYAQEPSSQAAHVQASPADMELGTRNQGVQMTPELSCQLSSRPKDCRQGNFDAPGACTQAQGSLVRGTERQLPEFEVNETRRPNRRPRRRKGEEKTAEEGDEEVLWRRERNRCSAHRFRLRRKEAEKRMELRAAYLQAERNDLESQRVSLQMEFNGMYEYLQMYCGMTSANPVLDVQFRQFLASNATSYRDPTTGQLLGVQLPPAAYQQALSHEQSEQLPAMMQGLAPFGGESPPGIAAALVGEQLQYSHGSAPAVDQSTSGPDFHDPRQPAQNLRYSIFIAD